MEVPDKGTWSKQYPVLLFWWIDTFCLSQILAVAVMLKSIKITFRNVNVFAKGFCLGIRNLPNLGMLGPKLLGDDHVWFENGKKKTNDIIKASKHEGEKVTSKTCDFAVNFGFNIFVYKFIQPRLEMLIFRQNPWKSCFTFVFQIPHAIKLRKTC